MLTLVVVVVVILFLLAALVVGAQQHQHPLFREYIGAEGNNVKFSDVPINDSIEFHFILSFAIDYTTTASPTNGVFKPFWDTHNLDSSHVSSIKSLHPNLKVAMSLGGDTVGDDNHPVFFKPTSVNSWLTNAIRTITQMVRDYNLDGIDIDYEHFGSDADPDTFAECIGRLLLSLKSQGIIKFASIAPFDDDDVQRHYKALWNKYGHLIDYVNFQFYSFDQGTNIGKFLEFYDEQSSNYRGGKVLVSFATDNSGGLKPDGGFFKACSELKRKNKLQGIFIWSADDSKKLKFRPEIQSQSFLLAPK
ncbi:Chitinase 2 [Linum perenne]